VHPQRRIEGSDPACQVEVQNPIVGLQGRARVRQASYLRAGEKERMIVMTRPDTKILVDGGDPQETQRVKELLSFIDGQTTNPSLIAES
jgi:hypothetical protein